MKHWNEMSARWHQDYERGRPGYPRSAVEIPGLPASASVLELGAGTGKLTRLLVADYAEVFAIEPDPEMRRWLNASCPRAALVAGTAEEIPLANGTLDAVFSAEAFHWFSHERALDEIARVLRPDGRLFLMWNRPAGTIEPKISAVEELLEPLWPEGIEMPLDLDPRQFPHARDWPASFADSAFEPLRESRLANTQVVDRDGMVAFFGSMGWIGALPDDELLHLLDEVRSRLVDTEYRMPFETFVYRTRLARPG